MGERQVDGGLDTAGATGSCFVMDKNMAVEELVELSGGDGNQLLPGLLAHSGNDFLAWIVAHLAETLQIDCVFVGELTGADYDHIETLEVYSGMAMAKNFTYELRGTPCEEVLSDELFY